MKYTLALKSHFGIIIYIFNHKYMHLKSGFATQRSKFGYGPAYINVEQMKTQCCKKYFKNCL